jgi:hypothetical protein
LAFIRVYKLVYIFLLAGSFISCFLTPTIQYISATLSLGALSINAYNFYRISRFTLGQGVYATESIISIGRLIMTLTVGLGFGASTMVFSPLGQVFWIPIVLSPIFEQELALGSGFGIGALQLLCSILIALELYYVWLLKKNRDGLGKILPH